MITRPMLGSAVAMLTAATAAAQSHSTPIARRPHSLEIAVVNSDQDSVSVVNSLSSQPLDLDPGPGVSRKVGSDPRTLTFTPDGLRLYVASKRGEGGSFPNSVFGSVQVLDAANGYAVLSTIAAGIGVEPFGVAAAADGGFVAVTN